MRPVPPPSLISIGCKLWDKTPRGIQLIDDYQYLKNKIDNLTISAFSPQYVIVYRTMCVDSGRSSLHKTSRGSQAYNI